ncbi:MAG: hypothetical protein GY930_14275 [bacterium]|nr:hypothetical protein [bacterium]
MKGIAFILIGVFTTHLSVGSPHALETQETPSEAAARALQSTDFLAASEAAQRIVDPGKRNRMLMDVRYAGGDLAGALVHAQELMALGTESPQGAYMATRLALDLGLLEQGQSSLALFQERLVEAQEAMQPAAFDWYVNQAAGLQGQADLHALQVSNEETARQRSKAVIAGAILLVLAFLTFAVGFNRKEKNQPAI